METAALHSTASPVEERSLRAWKSVEGLEELLATEEIEPRWSGAHEFRRAAAAAGKQRGGEKVTSPRPTSAALGVRVGWQQAAALWRRCGGDGVRRRGGERRKHAPEAAGPRAGDRGWRMNLPGKNSAREAEDSE